MGMGGAYQDAFEKEQKRKAQVKAEAKIKAEALAAESTAVYNLREIRKLEARVEELEGDSDRLARLALHLLRIDGEIKALVNNQSVVIDNQRLDVETGELFADGIELLTRLVERMGRDLDVYIAADYGTFIKANLVGRYPYALSGQREYDAAMHDAEGPDVRREDCVP